MRQLPYSFLVTVTRYLSFPGRSLFSLVFKKASYVHCISFNLPSLQPSWIRHPNKLVYILRVRPIPSSLDQERSIYSFKSLHIKIKTTGQVLSVVRDNQEDHSHVQDEDTVVASPTKVVRTKWNLDVRSAPFLAGKLPNFAVASCRHTTTHILALALYRLSRKKHLLLQVSPTQDQDYKASSFCSARYTRGSHEHMDGVSVTTDKKQEDFRS